MIDEKTLEALTTHLSVQLAVTPKFRLRELAKANPGDEVRQKIAADLARSLAAPFDITPTATPLRGHSIAANTKG